MTHVMLVAVESENLPLRVPALDFPSQQDLLDLAVPEFFRRQKEESGQLLGNRARALGPAHTDQIFVSCAHYGEIIDAGMVEELIVFSRQYGILQVGGDFVMSDYNAPFNR